MTLVVSTSKTAHCILVICFALTSVRALAQEIPPWKYSADLLRPFWLGSVVEGESVLFFRDEQTNESRASLLFPIRDIISVRSSSGDVTYQDGIDYQFRKGTREIVIPTGSRIVTSLPSSLRRPANSQQHRLTHRDGNGEIFFGANLEYHRHANDGDLSKR